MQSQLDDNIGIHSSYTQVPNRARNTETTSLKGQYNKYLKDYIRYWIDQSTPYTKTRWSCFFLLLLLYIYRVYTINGYYIVSYALSLYILNQFLGFQTPLDDNDIAEGAGSIQPLSNEEEFKPFFRLLPEIKFWYGCTRAVTIAMFLTYFSIFNIPAFWPILAIYFCILFFVTIKKQIRHMIKYKYVPFNIGKRTYERQHTTF